MQEFNRPICLRVQVVRIASALAGAIVILLQLRLKRAEVRNAFRGRVAAERRPGGLLRFQSLRPDRQYKPRRNYARRFFTTSNSSRGLCLPSLNDGGAQPFRTAQS